MEAVRKKGKIYMVIAVVIALICAIRLCAVRIDVEQRNMTIEQAMDYESLISMAKNDGYDEATVMQMAKDAPSFPQEMPPLKPLTRQCYYRKLVGLFILDQHFCFASCLVQSLH